MSDSSAANSQSAPAATAAAGTAKMSVASYENARSRREQQLTLLNRKQLIRFILDQEFPPLPSESSEAEMQVDGSPSPAATSTSSSSIHHHSPPHRSSDEENQSKRARWEQPKPSATASTFTSSTSSSLAPLPTKKGKKDTFDFANSHVRCIALKFMYVGTDFLGFAEQPTADGKSVEGELFRALLMTRLIPDRESAHLSRCGRTDKGVHASGQVVALQVRTKLKSGLGVLPKGQWDWKLTARKRREAREAERERKLRAQEENLPAEERERRQAERATKLQQAAALAEEKMKDDVGNNDEEGGSGDEAVEADDQNACYFESDPIQDSMCPRCGVPGENYSTDADCKHHVVELDYIKMLNSVLPDSIRVASWQPVPSGFSARFSCTARTYRYFFFADGLDLERMQKAADLLQGSHDFRNFCKVDPTINTHFTRYITKIQVKPCEEIPEDCVQLTAPWPCEDQQWFEDSKNNNNNNKTSSAPSSTSSFRQDKTAGRLHPDAFCELLIHGNAFLYHQVRCMSAILFLIGRGVEEIDLIQRLLDVKTVPSKPNYDLAPEAPLVLYDTWFPSLPVVPGFEYQPCPATKPQDMMSLVAAAETTLGEHVKKEIATSSTDASTAAIPCLYPSANLYTRNAELCFSQLHNAWRVRSMECKVHELFLNQCARNLASVQNASERYTTPGARTKLMELKAATQAPREKPRKYAPLLDATFGCRGNGLRPLSQAPVPPPYSSVFNRPAEKTYAEKVEGLTGKKLERHQNVKQLSEKFRKNTSYAPSMNKIEQ